MKIPRNSGGFTLIELLSILLLLGILSVVAASRLDLNRFRTAGFTQELLSAIRFAQKFAIVSGCEVEVTVDGTGYELRVQAPASNPPAACVTADGNFLSRPTGGIFDMPVPSGVTITGGGTFVFDRQGGTPVTQSMTIGTQTITVEAVTGYAHL